MKNKCESCRRGLNGRDGNGYSPCGCNHPVKPDFVQPPKLIEVNVRAQKLKTTFWGKWFK